MPGWGYFSRPQAQEPTRCRGNQCAVTCPSNPRGGTNQWPEPSTASGTDGAMPTAKRPGPPRAGNAAKTLGG
eukprot:9504182-Pyramimonas_sp.AAC.9